MVDINQKLKNLEKHDKIILLLLAVPASTIPPPHKGYCPDESWVPYGHECLYFANGKT